MKWWHWNENGKQYLLINLVFLALERMQIIGQWKKTVVS